MVKKRTMTGWYDPAVLMQTGIRVAISTVFGQFADRREAIAAANAIEPQPFDASFDYAKAGAEGDFWFDFVADTGDGWNSTYAVARLLAEDSLQPQGAGTALPRGRLLVMGGDQVYPTASRSEYEDRLIAPFEQAQLTEAGVPRWAKEERPDLFAIPGNHDWYDGLNAFSGLFCRRRIRPLAGIGSGRPGRVIGGRQTQQTRSYFAIRLPGDWWIWATDSQLEGYIDQPQIDYFQHVAGYWMEPGSKLILCVAEPSWAYLDVNKPKEKFANFSYLERLAGASAMPEDRADQREGWPQPGQPLGHRLKLVLTGDSHHYARYVEGDRHYITCGGGGAFLHPTHQLHDKAPFDWDYPEPGIPHDESKAPYKRSFTIGRKDGSGEEAIYPGRSRSWWLTMWNFLFAFKNWKFPLLLWPAYLLFTWMLDFNARTDGKHLRLELDHGSLADAAWRYWELAFISPWAILLAGVAFGAYYYFAAVKNRWGRLLMGGLHALFQAIVVTMTTCLVVRWSDWDTVPTLIAAAAASAFLSSTAFGTYLWFSLAVLKRHANEAYSSFGHRGYKCFLRLRILPKSGGLEIYPVGLEKTPFDRWKRPRNPKLAPHLIEQPITIV